MIDALEARLPAWLPGFRVRVLDGNLLSKTQRRIRELRQTWAAGLPGRVLAVYDQEQDLVTDVFLNPDGHASERTLLDDVLAQRPGQGLVDCRQQFLHAEVSFRIGRLNKPGSSFASTGRWSAPAGQRRYRGRTDTGKVYEQELELT